MAEDFQILLLGPPAVYHRGQSYPLSRRGLRSLLYYLACQRKAVARSELIVLFWEDAPEREARQNLRVTLSRLRGALPNPEMLRIEQEQVELVSKDVTCDMRMFEDLYEETARACAQIPPSTPLPEGVRQRMVRALGLWRGARFLAGADLGGSHGLDSWLMSTADHLDGYRQRLLERLADHGVAAGDLEASINWLNQILALNPTSDPIHLRLLELLERQGRLNEALIHLQKAQAAYREDGFGMLPSSLRAVEERLRTQRVQSLGEPVSRPGRPGKRTLQIPLVGRRLELETLFSALLRKQPVFVLGEAGSGKSRLVEEFLPAARPPLRAFQASARAMVSNSPFQLMIELLRGQVALDEWRTIPRTWLSAMTVLLPELETLFPGTDPPSEMALTQSLMLEALFQVFMRLSSGKPFVLVVDDAQWGDESSFAALAYLLEKGLFRERAGLIVAARIEDQPPAFQVFFEQILAVQDCAQIRMLPLEMTEIAEIVETVFGREGSPELIARLRQDTGGNPLFLLETLRVLLDFSPDALDASPSQLPLAGSIHNLVRDRLQRLSSDAQNILTYAAVIGNSFSLDLLEKAGRFSPEQALGGLDELEGSHLVRPQSDERRPLVYSFIHEKLREVVLLELSSARRRFYYLRVADALKDQVGGPDKPQLAALAELYEEAGEDVQAFECWLGAAVYARQLFSNAQALRAYHRADAIYQRGQGRIGAEGVVQLYSGWVELGFNLANPQEVRQAAEEMQRTGWRTQNLALIRGGFMGLAAVADLGDQAAEGLQILEQVRPFMVQPPGASSQEEWMMFHYRRGGFLAVLNRFEEAVAELEEALQMSRELTSARIHELRANCGYRLAGALIFHGELNRAIRAAEQSFDESRAAMNHPSVARSIVAMSTANFYLGRYAAVKEQASFAERMLKPMQSPRLSASLFVNLAQTEVALGHLDEGWLLAGQTLETGRSHAFKRILIQAYRVQADVLCLLGDTQGALELYRQSVAIQPVTYLTMDSLYRLGMMLVQQGDVAGGLEAIDQAIEFCKKGGVGLFQLPAEGARAAVLLQLGRFQEAVELAEEVVERASRLGMPSVRGLSYQILGQVALQNGRMDEARQKGMALARQGREVGSPFIEISGLRLVLSAEQKMERQEGHFGQRLRELLELIGAHTQLPELRPAFEGYAQSFRA